MSKKIYYGSRGAFSETESNPERPDYGFRKSFIDDWPEARFHACCRGCSVQDDTRLGIQVCKQCENGPDFNDSGRKWDLASYARPKTEEEAHKLMKSLSDSAEKYADRKRQLYNKYK